MAAYAALRSVMHIVDQLQHHPFPPISIEKKQVESLTINVTFLLEFLEGYPSIGNNEGDGLESRILDAANAAEDVIESYIVDRIRGRSTSHADEVEFGQRLQKVIEDMDLIKNETMETTEKMGAVKQQLQLNSTSSSGGQKLNTTMVGFEDALLELLDKLTRGGLNRQIIPIVGMGGMGKTTLARNVYAHPLIKEHFDILAWTTISQEYDARKILSEIVSQAMGNSNNGEENQVGEDLYKYLFGRRFLIVLDDMWSIGAWDKIKCFFPDNNNGSRLVITTRLSDLARRLSNSSYSLHMSFLDMDESWDLFSKIVFPGEDYPPEMVEIGRKIVGNCRGLPLSIVMVAGFLAKSEYKREHWQNIVGNLNSVVNSDNDEHGFKILQLSYNQLPVHLRPCFLYMGMFKEDEEIRISTLVMLWVAEGFLKPISGKDLEEVAEEYLYDLIGRNLIFTVNDKGKDVKVHDLLRDLCIRQAKAERFYNVVSQPGITIPHNYRRFIVSEAASKEEIHDVTMSRARSMISYARRISPSPHHSLLRIFAAVNEDLILGDNYFQENKFQLVNFRCLFKCRHWDPRFATSLPLLWSLQTLFLHSDASFTAPAEIWNMPQLRNVSIGPHMHIPDPPTCSGQGDIVLENLQRLKIVKNFKCSEEMVKRIPNIKKLSLLYEEDNKDEESCLNNLDRLHKLKSLYCGFYHMEELDGTTGLLHKLSFPRSLKKLVVEGSSYVYWEDMMEKIGSLPFLEKLKFRGGCFRTHVWETVEGQFLNLRYLEIYYCDLENWYSESTHFPRLEHLLLYYLYNLNEIPEGIGGIPTLQSIKMVNCSKSAIFSCKRMQVEQEELYGEDEVNFQVRVQTLNEEYEEVQHLKSTNFKVEVW